MAKKVPPVPPANRSDKGPGSDRSAATNEAAKGQEPQNLEQQGQQGNIKQNTTHQGYQQDR